MKLSALEKKLKKEYGGRVSVTEKDNTRFLSGELDSWQDIVSACMSAVHNKKKGMHVVNDIKLKGTEIPPMRMPSVSDDVLEGRAPDILIIGGGISGEGDYLLNMLPEKVFAETYSRGDTPQCELKIAELGNDAGIIGAAALGR